MDHISVRQEGDVAGAGGPKGKHTIEMMAEAFPLLLLLLMGTNEKSGEQCTFCV